jgi:hypothetical protein
MMQSSVEVEKSALSDLKVGPAIAASCPTEKLRQIIVPVDLTNDCTASIDHAIRFAKAFGSTVNLLHLYQDPYAVSQSSRSPNCDLFKEQRRKIFADFYNLLRETQKKYADSGNAPCPVLVVREEKTDFIGRQRHGF